MSKTMTETELNEAIAKLKGKKLMSQDEMRTIAEKVWKEQPHCTHFGIDGFTASPKDEGEWVFKQMGIPDYCNDIRAAMELWRELPDSSLFHSGNGGIVVLWRPATRGPQCTNETLGKEAQAIARAWYQWKTGQAVEIRENDAD